MSGSIVNTNGSSSITITNLINQLQGLRPGFDTTVLTNYSTQAKPAIAAGGYIEDGGSLYLFSTQEEISTTSITSTTDFTYFVELVPSSSTITAQFSSTVPSFREDYGAWYLSTASNHRVIAEMEKNGASTYYWYKSEFKYLNRVRDKIFISSFSMSSVQTSVSWDHHFTNVPSQILTLTSIQFSDASTIVMAIYSSENSGIENRTAYSTYFYVSRGIAQTARTGLLYVAYR